MSQRRKLSRTGPLPIGARWLHIAKIDGPTSSIFVEILADRGSEHRKQRVIVHGPVSVAAATELAHLQLASNRRYLIDTREWEVEVIGDGKFAGVRADNQCRDFCRYLISGAYSFDRGKWTLINGEVFVE